MTIIDFIKSVYYEFLSYFVVQKQKYKITGKCIKCGKCCREIRSRGLRGENDLKLMQFIFPWYKRFYIKGEDETGNIVLSCRKLRDDGKCSVYFFRPLLCRNYPAKTIDFCGQMPDGCGYVVEKKKFEDFMN